MMTTADKQTMVAKLNEIIELAETLQRNNPGTPLADIASEVAFQTLMVREQVQAEAE
jgi:hypothetical protein